MLPPKVLITRPIEAAQPLALALNKRGYQAIVDPLLEIVPIPFTLPPGEFDAVFITSSNAVRAMEAGIDKRTQILTVGETTAATAEEAGFISVNCIGQTVVEAAQTLVKRGLDDVLYLSGTHVTSDLQGYGPTITRVPVYDTRVLDLEKTTIDLLYGGDIASILLFSRRSAEVLSMVIANLAQTGWMAGTQAVCLSKRTADPVRALPWNSLIVAAEPTEAAMIAALPEIA